VTHLYFFNAQTTVKKSKRATKPTQPNRHEMTTNNHDRKEGRSVNTMLVYSAEQYVFSSAIDYADGVGLIKITPY